MTAPTLDAVRGVPIFDEDLFAPDILRDGAAAYARIRDLGDVVWNPPLNMYVAGRFADVKAGLRDYEALISGRGVTVNGMLLQDDLSKPVETRNTGVLTMDGEEHGPIKTLLMKPLTPAALQSLKALIEGEAAAVVDRLADGREFEAMSTLASHLPIRIVADLVGLNQAGHERLLAWSEAAFDCFGPKENPRTVAALPSLGEFVAFAGAVTREDVAPGGWAAHLFDAVDRGEISLETARLMIFDYATPSLDTTILATGELLWRMATVEGAFAAVRADPSLIPSAVYEAARLATPIRGFTRYVERDFAFSDTVVPRGSRVFLLNAAANLDERHYPDPDRFDVARNPRDNLAWGHGRHICAGMHLARLEMEALLGALARRVKAIEAAAPTRLVNNGLQGYRKLPLVLHPA